MQKFRHSDSDLDQGITNKIQYIKSPTYKTTNKQLN